MKQLILHPTDTSQWHALVNEAQASTNLILSEGTESYLVFLLMRFSQTPHLLESVVALDFLESMNKKGRQQFELLKSVGDKSLLFSGLFPGMAKKRHVSLSYFLNMGQSAYSSIGDIQQSHTAKLYYELSEKFHNMQQILQAMRSDWVYLSDPTNPNIEPDDTIN